MSVFISHSFENKPEFDNIADALEQNGVQYWKPGSLKAGASLADQLRSAIKEADLCVFVATRHSIQSHWCGAELGAFWGAGKPVVVYVAEASLKEEEMPKQFAGQLFERRISGVVKSVQSHLHEAKGSEVELAQAQSLAAMSRSELQSLLTEAFERVRDVSYVETTLSRLIETLPAEPVDPKTEIPEQRKLIELATSLLGLSETTLRQGAVKTKWRNEFSFKTASGQWNGRALSYEPHDRAPLWFYRDCLVWRCDASLRIEAIALLSEAADHDEHGIVATGKLLLMVGRGSLGEVVR